jgi:hypothetical protein
VPIPQPPPDVPPMAEDNLPPRQGDDEVASIQSDDPVNPENLLIAQEVL